MPRTTYTPDFKAKVVLEVLQGGQSLDEVASAHSISPNMLQNWKKDFITNASHVFEGNKQAKEARRKEDSLKKEKDQMLKTIGQLTLERNFLQGCFHQCGREVPRLDSEDV